MARALPPPGFPPARARRHRARALAVALVLGAAGTLWAGGVAASPLGATTGGVRAPESVPVHSSLAAACPGTIERLDQTFNLIPVEIPGPGGEYQYTCGYAPESNPTVAAVTIRIGWWTPLSGRTNVFGSCDTGEDTSSASGPTLTWRSGSQYLNVSTTLGFTNRDTILRNVLDTVETLPVALVCDWEAPGPPPGGGGSGGTPPGKSIRVPASGKTAKVTETLGTTTREVTVTVTGSADDLRSTGLAVVDKAQRLKKLKRVKERLEYSCGLLAFLQLDSHDQRQWELQKHLATTPILAPGLKACLALLEKLQQRIAEVEAQPGRRPAGVEGWCPAMSLSVRSEVRGGKKVVRVVEKGLKPRVRITCAATDSGFALTIRRQGKGTLRDTFGAKLVLTVRRSSAAPAPTAGARLTFALEQR